MLKDHRTRGGREIGLLLVLIGVLFLLDQFDVLSFGSLMATWWPAILLFVGALKFRGGDQTSGLVLLILGGVFLLANLDVIRWSAIGRMWPILLILVGLFIAFGHRRFFGSFSGEITDDQFEVRAIFGGSERRISSQHLKGGKIEALFGGVEVDLRDAKAAPDCQLRISVAFGGAEVRVPADWQIVITGTPILGGIGDHTRQDAGEGTVVQISCSAVLGGIEIRN